MDNFLKENRNIILQDNVRTNQNPMCITLLSLKGPYMTPQIWRLRTSQYHFILSSRTHVCRRWHNFNLQSFLHWQIHVYPSYLWKIHKVVFQIIWMEWSNQAKCIISGLLWPGFHPTCTSYYLLNLYMFHTLSKSTFNLCKQR